MSVISLAGYPGPDPWWATNTSFIICRCTWATCLIKKFLNSTTFRQRTLILKRFVVICVCVCLCVSCTSLLFRPCQLWHRQCDLLVSELEIHVVDFYKLICWNWIYFYKIHRIAGVLVHNPSFTSWLDRSFLINRKRWNQPMELLWKRKKKSWCGIFLLVLRH